MPIARPGRARHARLPRGFGDGGGRIPRRVLPAEQGGARVAGGPQGGAGAFVLERPLDLPRERVDVARRRVERGVAGDLDERVGGRADDRRAAGHGLEQRAARTPRERRIDEDLGRPVELARRLARGVARHVDLVAVRRAHDPAMEARRLPPGAAGEHEVRLRAAPAPHPLAGGHEPLDVLAGLQRAQIQDEGPRARRYRWRVRCRAAGSSEGQKNARSTPLRATRTRGARLGIAAPRGRRPCSATRRGSARPARPCAPTSARNRSGCVRRATPGG